MIGTDTISENLSILKEVLILVYDNLLEFKLYKCGFLKSKVRYVGYVVSNDGIVPNPENVKPVSKYSVPDSLKKVQTFLGLKWNSFKVITEKLISAPILSIYFS